MTESNDYSFDPETLLDSRGRDTKGGKYERYRIKKGEPHNLRILPPFGRNNGRALFHKYVIHWGLLGSKGTQKPVSCSWPTEGYCPICNKVKDTKKTYERLLAQNDPKNQPQVDELKEYIDKYKATTVFAYNAMTYDGRVVILEIAATGHNNLMKRIKEAINPPEGGKPFDPVSIESGVWFTFLTGSTGAWYPVDFKKILKEFDGNEAEIKDRTKISEINADLFAKIKEQIQSGAVEGPLYDIHNLYEPKTAADLARMFEAGSAVLGNTTAAPGAQAEPSEPASQVAYDIPEEAPEDDVPDPAPAAPTAKSEGPTPKAAAPLGASAQPPAAKNPAPAATKAPAPNTKNEPAKVAAPVSPNVKSEIERLRELSRRVAGVKA